MLSNKSFFLLALLLAMALVSIVGSGIRYGTQGLTIKWVENVRAKTLLYNGPVITLAEGEELQQTFIANYPGLNYVDVLVQGDTVAKQLLFRLKTTCEAVDDVLQVTASLPPQTGLFFLPITFPALDNSTGQSYCMLLRPSQASVSFPLSSGDLYPAGHLKLQPHDLESVASKPDKAPTHNMPYKVFLPLIQQHRSSTVGQDIGFNLGYQGNIISVAQIFFKRLTTERPLLWGQSWFYGVLAVIYVGLLLGLFALVWQMVAVQKK